MTVDLELSEKLKSFHSSGKPIGLCCISPVIAAKLIPGVEVTVGMCNVHVGMCNVHVIDKVIIVSTHFVSYNENVRFDIFV